MINYLRPEGYYVHIPNEMAHRYRNDYEWFAYGDTIPYFGVDEPAFTWIHLNGEIDGHLRDRVGMEWCGYKSLIISKAPVRVLRALSQQLTNGGGVNLQPGDRERILRYIPTYIGLAPEVELDTYQGSKPYREWYLTRPSQPLPRRPVRIAVEPQAATIPLGDTTFNPYLRNDRYPVRFDRIVTPRFTNTTVPLINPFA